MPNPLADEARALSDMELGEAINEAYREMFNLQFQRGTRQLQNPMAIRAARRQIARLRTIYRERQQGEAVGAPLARPTAPVVPPPSEASSEAAPAEEDAAAAEVEAAEPAEGVAEPTAATDPPATEAAQTDAEALAEEDAAAAEVEAVEPAESVAEPTPAPDAAQTSKDD